MKDGTNQLRHKLTKYQDRAYRRLPDFVHKEAITNLADFDTGMGVWRKTKYDAVIYFTTIKFI